jgi:hypothetical protein
LQGWPPSAAPACAPSHSLLTPSRTSAPCSVPCAGRAGGHAGAALSPPAPRFCCDCGGLPLLHERARVRPPLPPPNSLHRCTSRCKARTLMQPGLAGRPQLRPPSTTQQHEPLKPNTPALRHTLTPIPCRASFLLYSPFGTSYQSPHRPHLHQ